MDLYKPRLSQYPSATVGHQGGPNQAYEPYYAEPCDE